MAYEFRGMVIPDNMMKKILTYIEDGVEPGGFLTAVISNDLSEAVGRADDENILILPAYVAYFHNEAPSICHGSEKKMDDWLLRKMEDRLQVHVDRANAVKL